MLITVRVREDNEDLSVSNSSSFEPSATLKALSGNRPSSRVSSYAERILYERSNSRGRSRCYRLPSGSPRRKRTLKPGKGLMSPSAEAHCDCSGRPRRESRRAMHHSPGLPPQPVAYAIRTRLRPRLGQSYINDTVVSCTPGHLYGCFLPGERSAA